MKSALTWKAKKEKASPQKVAKAQKQGKPIPPFKPVRCPQSELVCIRYDQRSSWVKWDTGTCSLASIHGRIELPFTVPDHLLQYVGHKTCSADLCYRTGRYTLHIVVEIPVKNVELSHETLMLGYTTPKEKA